MKSKESGVKKRRRDNDQYMKRIRSKWERKDMTIKKGLYIREKMVALGSPRTLS